MEEKQTGLVAAFAAWLRENEKSAATVEKYAREAASVGGGEPQEPVDIPFQQCQQPEQ